ncbi:MAG: TIGR04282 family arsenosugar biosynthesis glycosyltransferase [Psychroflexus halocasei]|uniref:TIGR04282 family arsenosugar biosynthesis glycosyltransferase n=1 Tax=Psychroflexus sp. S27 TaxID=1982757 RepID=UPI000C2B3FD2|nr:DUF2064 domain-containing protein [Psychroflexus sp. S27]PJX22700.1 hypothetical protein CAP47_06625 [Psychroflexus sp. S27]
MLSNTAILFFYQNPKFEKKNLGVKRQQFFHYQNNRILKELKKSGFEFFCYDESKQRGQTFAERYLNAIDDVFKLGYKQVISIGNDSPHLNSHHLNQAAHDLQKKDMCFGPSYDGGFYLWGLTRSCFDKDVFSQLNWQSSIVLDEITNLAVTNQQSYSFLEKLIDIDNQADVDLILKSEKKLSKLITFLLSAMLSVNRLAQDFHNSCLLKCNTSIYYNKGSPLDVVF